ncbi:hypothetical protein ABZ816_33020 [Actinosynnema sp. NPDC047251]|uniref:Plasmid maintenance system killer protein n=1 Tax=Saccharothrix espanaensis (strain ATCC 51144 / DSM 44229 / JCM 9112 / NBRC 15066 / NRRL 15764) TaxID=1179773 RepID=K3W431_SACES|nr:hypothetical protein [Saccharothrix espanaensis]CCH27388.1 hypothetical protein BN6_00560 [Saccharothrix espanaensis DSM 44229]
MSAPPYELLYTAEASAVLEHLRGKQQYAKKLKKIRKALTQLEQLGPRYPALRSHQYQSVPGPNGAQLWESYVENNTPSAWRIWWIYGLGEDQITIVTVGPHP